MRNLVRQEVFDSSRTLIIKIGSNVLTRSDDQLNEERIRHLSDQIDRLMNTGRKVVVVSSGAVAAGIGVLGLTQRPQTLPELQASAAAGQTRLMKAWGDSFGASGHKVAQILLTVNDFRSRRRYLNIRNTIRTLLAFGVTPVINENDSVSIAEITLGDNDQLAAMIAALVPNPLMIILSSVDGLYDGPPDSPGSKVISLVEQPNSSMLQHVSSDQSSRGRGGMGAKLQAILNATQTGESVILANGLADDVLDQISTGEEVGTLFLASGSTIPAWKRWIGYSARPEGTLQLDDGACKAVVQNGKSLLAVGIKNVVGTFGQGASVSLTQAGGREVARGLVNYTAEEIRRIAGHRSESIPELLGHIPYREVIHRDNLVVTDDSRVFSLGETTDAPPVQP
ncbi:glutamate 5-kinase [Fuerstiella marisgermanici]|uniref:Glutamate 5-kinase n=1 Tax=Fuerstiella marisgermanici TaxID=1891926 RepID=A0A1P8WBK8_9PLAN|nr:glutamate 5-kinase [Fuerstiella marisgermanici]APZ91426.1 Glutamate 5-kinase [Fuerstiella marisgermanici]